MTRKSKRAKALDISLDVRKAVHERDNESCVTCGRWCELAFANSHYISRGRGGLGIEQNIVTQCLECHQKMDFGSGEEKRLIVNRVKAYLSSKYDDWNEEDLIYRR